MRYKDSWTVWRKKVNDAIGTIEQIFAKNVFYDNETSHLATDNVQGAIDILDSDLDSISDQIDGLATVARSGDYNDLENKPTIPTVNDGTLTIKKNNTTLKTFSANQASDEEVNISVPTKVSELENDSGFTSNQGTVTSVAGGTGLDGGTITQTGILSVKYGTTSGTACQGNDSRLGNARTPTSHASTSAQYGSATSSNFGHCKLSNTYNTLVGNADQGIGASQKGLNDLYKTVLKPNAIAKKFTATTINSGADITVNTGLSVASYINPTLRFVAWGLLPVNMYDLNGSWQIVFRNIYANAITLTANDEYVVQYFNY